MIGAKIKKVRELRNLSQEYMAEQLHITQQTYSRWERDNSHGYLERLPEIADILQLEV